MNTLPARSCCSGASGTATANSRWSSYLPTWLRGGRGIMLGAVVLAVGSAAFGWPWLVAAGIAPILLSLAPCAVMCALGLCMMGKRTQPSVSQDAKTEEIASSALAPVLLNDKSEAAPLSQPVREREHVTLS